MSDVKPIEPLAGKELRILQLTELELLIEFDRICRKNKIRYTIIGGTLLGAVRHKGFVPWDDDADVALLRSDYDAFVKALERDLDQERFYFQDRERTECYRWGYGKLRRKGTSFVRPNTEHLPYEQGVYIDVMPVDYIPDGKTGQLICNLICFFFRKAYWSEVGKQTESNHLYRFFYKILSFIPLSALNRGFKKFTVYLNRKPTTYLRCLAVPVVTSRGNSGYWRYRSKWLEHLEDYEFEGYPLAGFADSESPLRRMYGDYLKPVKFPPVSLSGCELLPISEIQVDEKLKEGYGT
ncbi:MAG: phosphorylcholine transferase LicD [Clostridium sp.]